MSRYQIFTYEHITGQCVSTCQNEWNMWIDISIYTSTITEQELCHVCRHVRMNETYEQMNSWVDFGNTWVRGERGGACGGALRWKNERLRGFVCEWVERSRQSHKVVVRSVSRTMFGCLVLVAGLECTLIPWFWALPHPCTVAVSEVVRKWLLYCRPGGDRACGPQMVCHWFGTKLTFSASLSTA